MEILNMLFLYFLSYYLKNLYFYQIIIIYLIFCFIMSRIIWINYIYDVLIHFENQFKEGSVTKPLYNSIKYVNEIYVKNRDKIIYYLGKFISIIFVPKGIVNLLFMGLAPKTDKQKKNKPVVKEQIDSISEEPLKTSIFKSDREMYQFLENLKSD